MDTRTRAAYYRKLQELTGTTSSEAVTFIGRFRGRPTAWQEFLARVVSIAENPPGAGSKEPSVVAPGELDNDE